eukprot:scaffold1915_cov144-Amphora_coffeaeformis.AAC.9
MNRNSSVGNISFSSISELDAVISFNDSGSMNMSSISHMSGSYGSLQGSFQGSFSGGVPIIPGTSRFESSGPEQTAAVTAAPKMPQRGGSAGDLQYGHDSNASLSLDDIIEETSNHSACASNETGRHWNEGTAVSSNGVHMPVRAESFSNNNESDSSFASESTASSVALSAGSSTGVSFYSSMSSSVADTYAMHQMKSRCAV